MLLSSLAFPCQACVNHDMWHALSLHGLAFQALVVLSGSICKVLAFLISIDVYTNTNIVVAASDAHR